MRRRDLVALTLAVLTAACAPEQTRTESVAPERAPASSGSAVAFPSTLGGNASGYLYAPQTSVRKPAVILVPEWWGVNEWIHEQADLYAKQGYVTLVADLYRGKVAKTMEEAHELSRALPEDRANADVKAAFSYLSSRNDVDPARIAVLGWCLGGGYALSLATAEPRLAAAVVNYGRLVTDPASVAAIHAPLLGNFGAADRGIPPDDVHAFETAMKNAGKEADIRIFDHAGHAFMNPSNKEGYDAKAAAAAQERIDGFFAEKLRAKIPNS